MKRRITWEELKAKDRERHNLKSYEARQIKAQEGKIHCILPSTKNAFPSEWQSWQSARQRVTKPKGKDAHYYDGLTMDPRWDSFDQFVMDMGAKPSPDHTIDRLSKGYGYWPFNCRWADKTQQSRNTLREGQISLPIVF